MKRMAIALISIVITTEIWIKPVYAQLNATWNAIAIKYKACIKTELEAASNGDGTYDEVFFLEGKAHCDKMQGLHIRTARAEQRIAASETRIAQMTADLIGGAKKELGLK